MCIICYSPAGTSPTEYDLYNSNSNNPDGFGWAIRTPDGIVTGKTMDSDQAIDNFLALREEYLDFDAVYHARITTHGMTVLENNHPFEVKDSRTVLVHNGILPVNVPTGDVRSDTRIFAENILPSRGLEILDKKKARRKLEKWMTGSKMVIMSTREDLKHDTYILNEDAGVWDQGLWYSNSSYTYLNRYMATYQPVLGEYDGVDCPVCNAWWDCESEPYYTGLCETCNMCMDCMESKDYCFCWSPAYSALDWEGVES